MTLVVKLNADLVYAALRERYPVKMMGIKTEEMTISRPELYLDHSREFLSDHLYLATADHLPLRAELGKNVVIAVIGEDSRLAYYRDKCCLIVLQNDADFFAVHQDICSIFDRYYEWEKNLFDIFLGSADLQEIIDCSVPVFGCPIHGRRDNQPLRCLAEQWQHQHLSHVAAERQL